MMTKEEMQEYLRRWERVEAEETRLRRGGGEIPPLPDVIRSFDGAFKQAMIQVPPRQTSGLVEQQALFQKLPHG